MKFKLLIMLSFVFGFVCLTGNRAVWAEKKVYGPKGKLDTSVTYAKKNIEQQEEIIELLRGIKNDSHQKQILKLLHEIKELLESQQSK